MRRKSLPGAVTNLNAEADGYKVQITWTNPDGEIDRIEVLNDEQIISDNKSMGDFTDTGFEVTGYEPGTNNTFNVRAVNEGGTGPEFTPAQPDLRGEKAKVEAWLRMPEREITGEQYDILEWIDDIIEGMLPDESADHFINNGIKDVWEISKAPMSRGEFLAS